MWGDVSLGFDLFFPKDYWCWADFNIPFGHLCNFLEEMAIYVLCPFSSQVTCFLPSELYEILLCFRHLHIITLSDTVFVNTFSYSIGCLFTLLIVFFVLQQFFFFFQFDVVLVGYFCFVAYFNTFSLISNKSLPRSVSWNFFLMFSSRSCLNSDFFIFKSLIHFHLIFVYMV